LPAARDGPPGWRRAVVEPALGGGRLAAGQIRGAARRPSAQLGDQLRQSDTGDRQTGRPAEAAERRRKPRSETAAASAGVPRVRCGQLRKTAAARRTDPHHIALFYNDMTTDRRISPHSTCCVTTRRYLALAFCHGKSRDVLCRACRTARRDALVTTSATRTTRVRVRRHSVTGVDMSPSLFPEVVREIDANPEHK